MTCNEFSCQTGGTTPFLFFLIYIYPSRTVVWIFRFENLVGKNSMSMENIMSKTKSGTHMGNGGDNDEMVIS